MRMTKRAWSVELELYGMASMLMLEKHHNMEN